MMEFIWANWSPAWDGAFALVLGVVSTWYLAKHASKKRRGL